MEIMQKIEDVLNEQVRPMLEGHGGDAKLVDYADGVVWLEMQGACSGCPSADVTTRLFIEQTLRAALPDEIKKVELTQMVDPELLAFAKKVSGCSPNNKI